MRSQVIYASWQYLFLGDFMAKAAKKPAEKKPMTAEEQKKKQAYYAKKGEKKAKEVKK